jgi:hypothetical protein
MKIKTLFTAIILFFTIYNCLGQSAYYDAVKLKVLFANGVSDDAKFDEISTILATYLPKETRNRTDLNSSMIQAAYNGNPFIPVDYKNYGLLASPSGIGVLSSAIGDLNVTAFADGLAKFLVERTKEELNEAFFRKFAQFLENYPEFKTLFPNTNTFVRNFNSWEYANLINTLREAFDKDIKELLGNLIKLKDLTPANSCPVTSADCNSRISELNIFLKSNSGRLLLSALEVGNGIVSGQKIPDVIDSLTNPEFLGGYNGRDSANVINSVKLVDIFSYSLRNNLSGKHYISKTDIDAMINDPELLNIYLALVYQKIAGEKIQFTNSTGTVKVSDCIDTAAFKMGKIKAYLTNVSEKVNDLEVTFARLNEHRLDAKADLSPDLVSFFSSSQQLLVSVSADLVAIDSRLVVSPEFVGVLNNAKKGLQIANDISVRNYNAVVIGALKLISDAITTYSPNSRANEFAAAFLKYGSFAANVVNSKDPNDVKEAIKSFALPSGSSSLKKHSSFSITLNSYVGFVYGHTNKSNFTTKSSKGADSTVFLNGGKSIGVYAPVGIGLNWGLGWKKQNPWSISAFVSLIDVGALVGYRFVTDTGQISQKFDVRLGNIFAPGGNLIIGLPNMPISVGGGVQWIASLQRDPRSNNLYNIDHSGVRYQIFIAVDLPILNLHSSKKSLLYAKKY